VGRVSAKAVSTGGSEMNELYFVAMEGEFATLAQPRIESDIPAAYRLIHRKYEGGESEYVLQGLFTWTEGLSKCGAEWRDLPTQEEDSQNTPKNNIPFDWVGQ
jgi:hypothetical protein